MAANKTRERLTGIELKMPAAAVIAPGDVLVFGPAAGPTLIGIANDGQNMTTKPPYYSNSGYLALDTEGAFNIQTSAVATNITPGTPIYVHLGTPDATTNIRYLLGYSVFRPLVNLSYAADYSLWGLDPFGYHLTSVALHMANVALLFALVWRMLKKAGL